MGACQPAGPLAISQTGSWLGQQRWRAAPPQQVSTGLLQGRWLPPAAWQLGCCPPCFDCSAGQLPGATDADRRRMNESLSVLHDLTSRCGAALHT